MKRLLAIVALLLTLAGCSEGLAADAPKFQPQAQEVTDVPKTDNVTPTPTRTLAANEVIVTDNIAAELAKINPGIASKNTRGEVVGETHLLSPSEKEALIKAGQLPSPTPTPKPVVTTFNATIGLWAAGDETLEINLRVFDGNGNKMDWNSAGGNVTIKIKSGDAVFWSVSGISGPSPHLTRNRLNPSWKNYQTFTLEAVLTLRDNRTLTSITSIPRSLLEEPVYPK